MGDTAANRGVRNGGILLLTGFRKGWGDTAANRGVGSRGRYCC